MKKIAILIIFVFITLFISSCMLGLPRDSNGNYSDNDDNYRNSSNYQYNDNYNNQGYNRHRGRLFRHREDRNARYNQNSRSTREGDPVVIIR